MVADTELSTMSEMNKIRTNRLADALKMKNHDLGRSQSMRHPSPQPPSSFRTASSRTYRYPSKRASVDSEDEFRARSRTLPNEKRQFSPLIKRRDENQQQLETECFDEEGLVMERMRTFVLDPEHASVINRGDSFRCRSNTGSTGILRNGRRSYNESSKNSSNLSSRSHSPGAHWSMDISAFSTIIDHPQSPKIIDETVRKYHIIVLGSSNVGKTSLINQFMTSDYCNPFQNDSGEIPEENTVNVILDHEESQITFIEVNNEKSDMWLSLSGAGYIMMYSIDDVASFRNAERALYELRQQPHTAYKPIILVANKIDLERKRVVSVDDGKQLAKECSCKFVEIAVALDHHVDELLVGVLAQSRMNELNEAVISPKTESIVTFDANLFPSFFNPQLRSSSGSSNGSNNGEHKRKPRHSIEKWTSLKKLDGAMSTGCSQIASVSEKVMRKLFGRRRRSHSLEDLLAL